MKFKDKHSLSMGIAQRRPEVSPKKARGKPRGRPDEVSVMAWGRLDRVYV
jgi:hypothetical protein